MQNKVTAIKDGIKKLKNKRWCETGRTYVYIQRERNGIEQKAQKQTNIYRHLTYATDNWRKD